MLKPISRRELMRRLRRLGFIGPFSGGKHQFMEKGNFKISIPNPHGNDIGKNLLSRIIKDVSISEEDFEKLK
ncbi:MAG: type II toxin-antitoxin system HicA family toxin [Candidatus Giovannonibacteria bacterium]|nr:type II toxin-antitoxin system HicA family toxin [Candidatus Giovannonibacteria bacterium]